MSCHVPKDSVRHQSSTCLFNDLSAFRTRWTCITCKPSGLTTALTEPARVQPKAVRIAMVCPGRHFHTSCCNIASNTFAPSKTVTSSVLTSGILRLFRTRKSCIMACVTFCGGRFNCGTVQASSTAIWALALDPPVAPI